MSHKNPLPFIFSILFFNPFVYSHVIDVTHLKDFNTLLNNNNVVITKFFAPWCDACKAAEQSFNNLSAQYAEQKVPFAHINIDVLPDLGTQYDIQYLPTFIVFRQGEPIKKSLKLSTIEQALQHLDTGELGSLKENTLSNKIIEFILMPIYFISKILTKLVESITKLFS